jgi:creatinine amidohydrolase
MIRPYRSILPRLLAAGVVLGSTGASSADPGAFLGELTWPEAERRVGQSPLVVIPFGAGAKEHGPHLPMNADAAVMEHLCRAAVRTLPVIVAPPVLHGWFPAFRQFPGTEVADPDLFRRYVQEIAVSLARLGARRLVFLNTGITRATGLPLAIAAREIRSELGVPTLVVSWDDLETEALEALQEQERGGHAGEIETSIHLFLQPGLVQMEKAVADLGPEPTPRGPGYAPGLFSRDPDDPDYSETGLFGDPTKATADKGRQALEILTGQWLRALEAFSREPLQQPTQSP